MVPFFILINLLLLASVLSDVINKSVSRVIDCSSSIVRITTDITATGVENYYNIIYPNAVAEKIAFLKVKSKNKKLQVQPPVMDGENTVYTVIVKDEAPSLKVTTVLTNALEPYPAEITQREDQLVRFHDSHFFISPYVTETQKVTLKLASSTVESFTQLSPFSTRGSSIQFGPYLDVAPYSVSPLSVHFMNNFPFAKFSTMTKELEVSHWGSVSVEEIYELKHAGAALKGGFSRIEHQMMRHSSSSSFQSLIATLPAQASGIYYRDQIGNISTSDIRFDSDGDLELEIQTRFPIYGGWKTQFYLGYQLPTEQVLYIDDGGRYNLKFSFFTPFSDVWVDDMEIKVVLPEGCTDIDVKVPHSGVERDSAVRFTYLDSEFNGGRPVVILRAQNLVEEHDEQGQVHVSYSFQKTRMVFEPVLLMLCYFTFFCICSLLARASGISSASRGGSIGRSTSFGVTGSNSNLASVTKND